MRNLIFVCALMGILSLASAFTHPVTDLQAQTEQSATTLTLDAYAPATTLALPDFAPVLVVSPTDPVPAAVTLVNPADVDCSCSSQPYTGCSGQLYVINTSTYYPAQIQDVDYGPQLFNYTYVSGGNTYTVYDVPFSKWSPNGASFIITSDIQP